MEKNQEDKVLTFDMLLTNNHMNILKILMSYFDSKTQKIIAIYIKYQEFLYTLEYFKNNSYLYKMNNYMSSDNENKYQIYDEIKPYCNQKELDFFSQIFNIKNTFEQFQSMKEMMEMYQDIFPEYSNASNCNIDPMEIINSFISNQNNGKENNNEKQQTSMDE